MKRIHVLVASFLLFIFIALKSTSAFANDQSTEDDDFSVDTPGITTSEISDAASDALDNCLEYCVIGICISLICAQTCVVEYTAYISHRSSDLVVSSYSEPGEITWSDARTTLESTAKSSASAIVGFGIFEAGGGPNYTNDPSAKSANTKEHSTPFSNLHFKEVSVIGSPTTAAHQVKDNDARRTGGDNGYCWTKVEPAEPYFQSEIDAFEWRWGIAEKFYPASWLPGVREISQAYLTTWGGVHPRVGYVQSEHPARAASVGAQRAVDVTSRENQPHIYRHAEIEPSDEKTDYWQMVYPAVETECRHFGGLTDYTVGTEITERQDKYAFIYWPKWKCCPFAKGVVIAKIETGTPYCL